MLLIWIQWRFSMLLVIVIEMWQLILLSCQNVSQTYVFPNKPLKSIFLCRSITVATVFHNVINVIRFFRSLLHVKFYSDQWYFTTSIRTLFTLLVITLTYWRPMFKSFTKQPSADLRLKAIGRLLFFEKWIYWILSQSLFFLQNHK